MTRVEVKDPRELGRLMLEDQERLRAEVHQAMVDSAHVANRIIRSRVPVDTGELRRSVRVEVTPTGAEVVYDAPYALFQEVGTRPFTPPFEAILAWVMRQAPNMGLGDSLKSHKAAGRAVKRALKTMARETAAANRLSKRATSKRATIEKARVYARESAARNAAANAAASAASSARAQQDAALGPIYQRARAVWASIRKNGIKAKWFERDSLPDRRRVLAQMIARAIRQHKPAGAR